MAERDVGRVGGHVVGDGLAPKYGGLEDVGFIDGAEFFLASAGGRDRDLEDALDLGFFVNHRIDGLDVAVGEGRGDFGEAEINAAGEFADADDVDAVGDALGFERGGVGEFAVKEARADVGEKREVLAEREERGALGLFLGGEFFPLRSADGAEQDGVGRSAYRERGVGEGFAVIVDARAADVGLGVGEGEVLLLGDVCKHAQGLGHHLGANVVSSKDGELKCGHRKGDGGKPRRRVASRQCGGKPVCRNGSGTGLLPPILSVRGKRNS